jgi:quinol monooxygenase YgiN
MPFATGWSLHVTVYIDPENIDRFLAAFKPVFNKVVAEPECLFFEMYRSPQEPGKISWVENWSVLPVRL